MTVNSTPSASIVTCVEYGPLEQMTVRMVESLRQWGGAFADVPVYAVKPRIGIPLRKETRKSFEKLGVHYLDIRPTTSYAWFRFLNKPLAMMAVEEQSKSDLMIWLDADIIVGNEPTLLNLDDGEDFAVCASDKNVGTEGPLDEFEPFWVEAAKVFGYGIDDLPWITDERTGKPIRFYWNSGVFTYRRASKFAAAWHDATVKLLEAKLALKKGDLIFHEQMALGFVMLKMGMNYRPLPDSHNRPIGKLLGHLHDPKKFREAAILHYHGCMWPDFWEQFLVMFKENRPDIFQWLAPKGPVTYAPPLPIKAVKKVIDSSRHRKWHAFLDTCSKL